MNLRLLAAKIILEVEEGKSLTQSLSVHLKKVSKEDAAFVQECCFGVCRYYFSLIELSTQLLQKPIKQKDRDIFILMLVGLYQLLQMRVPEYAVISETVSAAKRKPWAKSLLNAVLRNAIRKKLTLSCDNNFPEWMQAEIKSAWPDHAHDIVKASDEKPPLSLRVNAKKISREDYEKVLAKHNISYSIIPITQNGITLHEPLRVENIPHFAEGFVSVQDGAAQIAVELMDLHDGQAILDACAAPGGKTAHIAESITAKRLLAIDISANRLEKIKDAMNRLSLEAQCIEADASNLHQWWDGEPFDRILLDAPCSASGVIRRHPDIKILRKHSDLESIQVEQRKILESLWSALKKDGMLIYVTCSIFPQENYRILQHFLKTHADAVEVVITGEWGLPCPIGRQILPGMLGMDGFYFARLKKI